MDKDIIDIFKKNNYSDNPKYNDKFLYANTENIYMDWIIFSETLKLMIMNNELTIDYYFYWMSFFKTIYYETNIKGIKLKSLDDCILNVYKNFSQICVKEALVDGHTLVLFKKNVFLDLEETKNYFDYLKKLREVYFDIYGRYPTIFKHNLNKMDKLNDEFNTHIVNYGFLNEKTMIDELEMEQVCSINELLSIGKNIDYISYISPEGNCYISKKDHEGQIMRKYITNDLGKKDIRDCELLGNCFDTAKNFVLYYSLKK